MSFHESPETLRLDDSGRVWAILSQYVEPYQRAWEGAGEPPPFGEYAPAGPPALRRLVLNELVKLDLKHRAQRRLPLRSIEEYRVELPELDDGQGPACDLIYEEFHARRQVDPTTTLAHYCERFPARAGELRRLLDEETPYVTTSLAGLGTPDQFAAGQSIDDFDLLSQLGRGAFAGVYLANQRSMQRRVALKISTDQGSEPQTMAQLDHPHIVRVFDQRTLSERGLRLLYMQYIPGGTLHPVVERIRRTPPANREGKTLLEVIDETLTQSGQTPPLDSRTRRRLARMTWPEAVCWLGSRLSMALDYAHRQGVLHRDIKPANVLLAAEGLPMLADFNVSFSSKVEGITPATYFGGSLAYMSPEQLEACDPRHGRRPEDLDGRSDIYSLGVLLWELLTGSRPVVDTNFEGSWSEMLVQVIARRRMGLDSAAAAQLPPGCPTGLDQILLKCLSAEPSERFATAGELGRQLEQCLHPDAQRLFRSTSQGWKRLVRSNPELTAVLAGMLPNAGSTVWNIVYNYAQMVKSLPPAVQALFKFLMVPAINGTAYPIGLGGALWLAWPIVRAVRGRGLSQAWGAPKTWAAVRSRCLRMGDWVAAISFALWIVSGAIIPAWLDAMLATADELGFSQYAHFFISQALCGLIAATLTFFVVTFINVRIFYPLLAQREPPQPHEAETLIRLARRTWIYFGLAVAAPFIALTLLALADSQFNEAFGVLGFYGLISFGLIFWMTRSIQLDLRTLAYSVNPDEASLGLSSDTHDSFWTSSR